MSRVHTLGAELAVGERSRSALPRGSRTAPGRAKGLEENGAGPSGGGEESVVFSNIEVRVKRAGPSGLGDLEVTISHAYTAGRSRERTAHLSTWQRPK